MKRFRRRISHTFHTQRMNSDNGISDLAERLSIEENLKENGDISKNGGRFGFLARASRSLSLSTSRIIDIHKSNTSVPEDPEFSRNFSQVAESKRSSNRSTSPKIVPWKRSRDFSRLLNRTNGEKLQ
ncbi:hypothetical protein X975_05326, partial [Stegodyphus mimosarum]